MRKTTKQRGPQIEEQSVEVPKITEEIMEVIQLVLIAVDQIGFPVPQIMEEMGGGSLVFPVLQNMEENLEGIHVVPSATDHARNHGDDSQFVRITEQIVAIIVPQMMGNCGNGSACGADCAHPSVTDHGEGVLSFNG